MHIVAYILISTIKILIWIGDITLFLLKLAGVFFYALALSFYFFVQLLKGAFFQLLLITKNKCKTLKEKLIQRIVTLKIRYQYEKEHISLILKQWYLKKTTLKKIKREKPIPIKKHPNKKGTIFPYLTPLKFKYFFAGTIFSFLFLFIPLLVVIFIQDLPNPKVMTFQRPSQATKIYDRQGKLLYQMYASENRTVVSLSSIPKYLQQATIAIEDKDFYKHPGFDISAIIRSIRENTSGNTLQGGSTITQQLIKSALLTPEISLWRKIKEVTLAFWAERIYTKEEILEMYFNQIPYGGTAWGIEAASQMYFGKHVQDLTLAESTFLAGIPKAPTIYSPFGSYPHLWKKRQKEVVNRMITLGYITKEKAKEVESKELQFQSSPSPIHAPHFVMYIKDFLVKKYGLPLVEKGGLTITTSLDLSLQEKIEKIIEEEVSNNNYLHLTNGASLITNPANGDILGMIGSHDFLDPDGGKVNLTTALRQPGSSIKVVTYSAALSKGFTPATILDDSPISYSIAGSTPYSPVNYDGRFHGRIPLRIALANSFNIPAVKILNQIGVPTMVDLAKKMGISTWSESSRYGLSITLGAAEVTMVDLSTVYGVLANGGYRVDINPILKITNQKGEILEEKEKIRKKLVLEEGVTFILSDILADNNARSMEFGPNSPLFIPNRTVSVKTGTSDEKRDNWTVGYTHVLTKNNNTSSYLVATWVGNNDNSPMSQNLASGITGAAPIWNKIMTLLLKDTKDIKPVMPFNVIQKKCLGRNEYFLKGTENSINCTWSPTPTPKKNN